MLLLLQTTGLVDSEINGKSPVHLLLLATVGSLLTCVVEVCLEHAKHPHLPYSGVRPSLSVVKRQLQLISGDTVTSHKGIRMTTLHALMLHITSLKDRRPTTRSKLCTPRRSMQNSEPKACSTKLATL